MSTEVARAHLERAAQRIKDAIHTENKPEVIGLAELAKSDIAAAVKETKADTTSGGGKRKEVKGQKALPFTPKTADTHTVDESGVVVEMHSAERQRVSDGLPAEEELVDDADELD